MVRVAVVGHVEWAEFVRVPHVPSQGEIIHASEWWAEPGGAGAVAAVQLGRLAGSVDFYTALGDDELGHRTRSHLELLGVTVHATHRPRAQRRVVVHIGSEGERTITVIGARMGPHRSDPLPWDSLAAADAVYFTAGDAGALRGARAGRVLVATPRALDTLAAGGVFLDALVGSAADRGEAYSEGDLAPPPAMVVRTEGARGGHYVLADGRKGRFASPPPTAPIVDTYGAGDSFAAGLTYALGAGSSRDDALRFAASCGATCLTGRGPYGARLEPPRPGPAA